MEDLGNNRALLFGKLNLPDELRGARDRLLTELVNVRFPAALLP